MELKNQNKGLSAPLKSIKHGKVFLALPYHLFTETYLGNLGEWLYEKGTKPGE